MKSAEKFYRRVHEEATAALSRLAAVPLDEADVSSVRLAVGVSQDLTVRLADLDKQAKARRERIEWIEAPNGIEVAKVGRGWAHYSYSRHNVLIFDSDGAQVARFETLAGTKGANRLIRAWRKKQ